MTWVHARRGMACGIAAMIWLVSAQAMPAAAVKAPEPVARPVADAAPLAATQEITLASLGYTDQTLRGIFASSDYFFPGPGNAQVIEGSVARIIIQYSEILLNDRSSLSVTFNGLPIANYRLVPQQAKRLAVEAQVPARYVKPDANQLRLQFYMRIIDEGCKDIDNPGLTATVSNETAMIYNLGTGTNPLASQADLATFPAPYFRPNDPLVSFVNFVIPPSPSQADYTAMASLSAKIGQLAGSKTVSTTVNLANAVPPTVRNADNLILIGTPQTNPLIGEVSSALTLKPGGGGFSGADNQAIPADQGVIQAAASPFAPGKSVLVVSGGNDEGVRRAAQVLSTNTLRRVLAGPYAVITDAPKAPNERVARDNGRTFALSDLGYDESTTFGLGTQTINMSFEAPPLDDRSGGYIDVVMSHSNPLQYDLSSVSVVLNNVPIASVGLRESNANRSVFRANIPPTTLVPGPNTLQFVFVLQIEKQDCSYLLREAAWGVIHKDTEIHLPNSPAGTQTGLQYYPYPFIRDGGTNNTALVLPDAPNNKDLSTAMQLALDLGRRATADSITLQAVPAGALNDATKRAKNLIVFGMAKDQPIIDQINNDLPLQFRGGELVLRQSGQALVTARTNSQVGVVQEIVSPLAGGAQNALLVVSATYQDGLDLARAALLNGGKLNGNVVTIGRDNRLSVLDVSTPTRPSLPTTVAAARNLVPTIATVVVIGLIGLLLLVMIFQSVRDRRRRDPARFDSAAPTA